ncbi:flagellar assembly protein FliH [Bordetella genomosp. 13]|uniref:Flagellar assembly protein FliH n=1 Tax=Bordetella genomosp. 13 TaxID=463040 RepID=A0A1W6ZBR4_9BORD|nr:flagellar assembly protein FliH [Bordetella genomosp. 13]ARP94294.1 flagellar assembly protein FliH [Bordetella genomosp. 13]
MSDHGSVESQLSRRAAWRRWQMVSFDEPEVEDLPAEPEPAPDPGPDPEEVRQALREQARTEGRLQGLTEGHQQGLAEGREQGHAEGLKAGREAGYAEGLAQAREHGRQEAEHLNALASSLATSLRALEEQLGQSLITLALDIAGQVVRERLDQHPEAMVAAVREVLHINPTPPQGALRLWVHPEDLELVRLHLADELKEGNWRVLADESITRGGCRAETPYGDIDATLQTRWRRVAASLGRSASWDEQA